MKHVARILEGWAPGGAAQWRTVGSFDRLTAARDGLAAALGGTAFLTMWLELQLGGYSAWLDNPRRMVGEIVVV